jgi:hypothetical protein
MTWALTSISVSDGFLAAAAVALMWGLAGGFSHCIGMCGVFVLSCGPIDESNPLRRLQRSLLFHCGRVVSLTALGAAAGTIGSLVGFAARFARAQGIVSVGVGLVLFFLAVGYVGLVPKLRIPEPDILAAGGGWGRRLFARMLRQNQSSQPLALGALVGLLPCGLTYTILIPAAATFSALRGSIVLLSFALGTIPGLLALGMAGHLFRDTLQSPRFRDAMTRSGAVIMAIMGIALIWRGWPNLF